ncbi:MAG: hypothetical protein M0Z61_01360 [Nitrospiraceae bacterium]|nr:hypothetical protein [Nitrospiraceae bacterium]
MSEKKVIESISPETAHEFGEMVLDSLGPAFRELSQKFNFDISDLFQFSPVSQQCSVKRQKLGFGIKEASKQSGVPQYRIKAIEGGSFSNITPETMRKYVFFLGLEKWYRDWTLKNKKLVKAKGLPVL